MKIQEIEEKIQEFKSKLCKSQPNQKELAEGLLKFKKELETENERLLKFVLSIFDLKEKYQNDYEDFTVFIDRVKNHQELYNFILTLEQMCPATIYEDIRRQKEQVSLNGVPLKRFLPDHTFSSFTAEDIYEAFEKVQPEFRGYFTIQIAGEDKRQIVKTGELYSCTTFELFVHPELDFINKETCLDRKVQKHLKKREE